METPVFRKIKCNGGRVHLEYFVEKNGVESDEYSFDSSDRANTSFYKAFDNLRKFVCEICDYPADNENIGLVEVTGVSFAYSNGNSGAVITAKKRLKNYSGPLNLNTPFLSECGDDMGALLPPDCITALDILKEEAFRYLEGDREQMDMFREAANGTAAG